MGRVVCDVTISMDGFVAGEGQSLDEPLGRGGEQLHRWQFEGLAHNTSEREAITAAGAFIMGRHMFGPQPGDYAESWNGWWGQDPPYRAPVFVLTHHVRAPLHLDGGNVFHFVDQGIHAALQQAQAAAESLDVAIAGGASTINQFLAAGLIDELRLHIAPVTLGAGERLFAQVPALKFTPVSSRTTDLVTHVVYGRAED